MVTRNTVLIAVSIRLLLSLSTQTFFQPDEYFQSLEVAHRLVFGYGYLTWEWMSQAPIRSITYPLIYAPTYWILKFIKLDDTILLILAPKILSAVIASATDIWLCDLTGKVIGKRYSWAAFFVSQTSFFHALALSRSLSNSLETSLTTVALSFYPWRSQDISRISLRKCLAFGALSCIIRPTTAVVWLFAFGALLSNGPTFRSMVILESLIVGIPALALVFVLDTIYYGEMTFTPLNFLRANLAVSSFYGVNQWHYYFTQALPILCTTTLPFVLHGAYGLWRSRDPASRMMLGLAIWTICIYSLSTHKEWRFLHPLLPLMHICAAKSLVDLHASHVSGKQTAIPIHRSHIALLALNIPAIIYVLLLHGRAQISVMHHLRGLPPTELDSLGVLAPCHSTPWQAYLHRPDLIGPGQLWAIGCEPPLGQNLTTYKDQTKVFYEDPQLYLTTHFPDKVDPSFPPSLFPYTPPGTISHVAFDGLPPWSHAWPRYLMLFGALLEEPGVQDTLERRGYREVWNGRNGWEEDERRRGGMRLWKWTSSSRDQ